MSVEAVTPETRSPVGELLDDVTGQESLVHSGGPVKASITLGSLE